MKKALRTFLGTLALASQAHAAEGPVPVSAPTMPKLNHVFIIVLENHSFNDIRGNALMPFINGLADHSAVATAYSATAHPSLPNYLAMIGGSSFNVASDNPPDWQSTTCTPFTDNGAVCPLQGNGTETATGASILGKNIGDQLLAAKRSWKSYQQNLPPEGVDGVDFSDGVYSNLSDFSAILPDASTTNADMINAIAHFYAVKHNPFAYFASGQGLLNPQHQAGFDGASGLYADLRAGTVRALSFIVPNQCNDEHGIGGTDPFCSYDPTLLQRSDKTVSSMVHAIRVSPAWSNGSNAIILLWDEDDYSESNRVPLIVITNHSNVPVTSSVPYNHYSLLKTLEAGFRLPCLNHACDDNVQVMRDLFH
jgi:phospholipase C